MPKVYPKGGESRLSTEGLMGEEIDGKRVRSIKAHGQRRRSRTVFFADGSKANKSIYELVGDLINTRGG